MSRENMPSEVRPKQFRKKIKYLVPEGPKR